MSVQCQVNVNSQSELDIGGPETCLSALELKISCSQSSSLFTTLNDASCFQKTV